MLSTDLDSYNEWFKIEQCLAASLLLAEKAQESFAQESIRTYLTCVMS